MCSVVVLIKNGTFLVGVHALSSKSRDYSSSLTTAYFLSVLCATLQFSENRTPYLQITMCTSESCGKTYYYTTWIFLLKQNSLWAPSESVQRSTSFKWSSADIEPYTKFIHASAWSKAYLWSRCSMIPKVTTEPKFRQFMLIWRSETTLLVHSLPHPVSPNQRVIH